MLKPIISVVAGYAVWSLMWLGGGQAIQKLFPDAVADDGSVSDPKALGTLLTLSVVCSIFSGIVGGRIAGGCKPPLVLSLALLATGGAVQAGLWDKMPLWYHLSFLAAIVPFVMLGAGIGCKAKPKKKD